jgi:hypothetical protein
MATAVVTRAQEILFGKDGLGASNFKMFPGSVRELNSELIAGEIVQSLEAIANGEFEELTID